MIQPFLAIETSTENCSVALYNEGRISLKESNEPQSHAKSVLIMIDALLRDAKLDKSQLTAIVHTNGPGSFTGIRIGQSITQGLAYSLGLPIVAFSSLAAVAAKAISHRSAKDQSLIIAALDARMGEIYWGVFKCVKGALHEHSPPAIGSVEQFNEAVLEVAQHADVVYGAGHGWAVEHVNTHSEEHIDTKCLPSAEALISLTLDNLSHFTDKPGETSIPVGLYQDPTELETLYLRNEVSWQKRKRIRSVPIQPDIEGSK